jgi:hypothetical protein
VQQSVSIGQFEFCRQLEKSDAGCVVDGFFCQYFNLTRRKDMKRNITTRSDASTDEVANATIFGEQLNEF